MLVVRNTTTDAAFGTATVTEDGVESIPDVASGTQATVERPAPDTIQLGLAPAPDGAPLVLPVDVAVDVVTDVYLTGGGQVGIDAFTLQRPLDGCTEPTATTVGPATTTTVAPTTTAATGPAPVAARPTFTG